MSGQLVRVMIVDDHDIIRRGLGHLLSTRLRYELVGEAVDAESAFAVAKAKSPHLVILDDTLPHQDSVDLAVALKNAFPRLELLMFSCTKSETLVRRCVMSGVRGLVLKSQPEADLIAALDAVSAHQSYFKYQQVVGRGGLFIDELSQRELQVIDLIAQGEMHRQVAVLMGISVKTVETHRANAMRKLGARSTADLVRYVIRNELIAA